MSQKHPRTILGPVSLLLALQLPSNSFDVLSLLETTLDVCWAVLGLNRAHSGLFLAVTWTVGPETKKTILEQKILSWLWLGLLQRIPLPNMPCRWSIAYRYCLALLVASFVR